ncbi:MAG: hypothetical protein U0350_44305 [Caldilineaceae bacterium]
MPQIIWFNQPTNHSGTVNFLFLDPDGAVGNFTLYVADGGGPYILGGPALSHDGEHFTEAALTLISLLPAGFHFFPPSSAETIRQAVGENRPKIRDNSPLVNRNDWSIRVYSKAYTTTQACDLLLNAGTPTAAIVFVDYDENGNALLAAELARTYYGLSKERRQELNLKPDWRHHWED